MFVVHGTFHNSHFTLWSITSKQLLQQLHDNSQRLCEATIFSHTPRINSIDYLLQRGVAYTVGRYKCKRHKQPNQSECLCAIKDASIIQTDSNIFNHLYACAWMCVFVLTFKSNSRTVSYPSHWSWTQRFKTTWLNYHTAIAIQQPECERKTMLFCLPIKPFACVLKIIMKFKWDYRV